MIRKYDKKGYEITPMLSAPLILTATEDIRKTTNLVNALAALDMKIVVSPDGNSFSVIKEG